MLGLVKFFFISCESLGIFVYHIDRQVMDLDSRAVILHSQRN